MNEISREYLTNVSLDEAVASYMKALISRGAEYKNERVKTVDACGRICANAVYAKLCAPHYNACAMDGVAVRAKDTFSASEASPALLTRDKYIFVDTGDPLPKGMDAVVMIEDCIEADDGIKLIAPAAPWQHIRQIGEDVAAGDMILPSFSRIDPAAVGAMLAGGVLEASVVKRPVVSIIPTGDEIVPPTDAPNAGEVMEFNSAIFSSMLNEWGAIARVCPIVRDNANEVEAAIGSAASKSDMVLVLAGTSAGRDDGTKRAIEALGEVVLHGIAIRPGKPAVLGIIGKCPVIGVPGYPVSGIIVLENIVKPIIDMLCKTGAAPREYASVRLAKRLNSSLKYREFVRASLIADSDGGYTAVPLERGAGVVTSFVKADCLIDVPQDSEGYEAGEAARALMIHDRERILRTVSIVGSHDPLIDEAADIMRRSDTSAYVSSSHVGSMGAIFAVGGGRAHMGGVHLLDADTGEYNEAYIEKYAAGNRLALIECVSRVQGIMVAKGNPKKIQSITDVAREGVSYVNRQRGAGTRVLFDYLLSALRISANSVYGYSREEPTHTAVAAQIAGGGADCGLGILSAANMYGLDFMPVANEQYDMLVSLDAMENEKVQGFLQALSSDELKARLALLGGYETDRPGRIRRIWN